MNKSVLFILLLCSSAKVFAQQDSLRSLEEVVITATRQERKVGNVAIPVQLIAQRQLKEAGSLRLKDILQEQPGLQLTTGFGTGLQMQGLNPEHTLILLDGQPLVGRTSGVLDLSRIALAGIKQIEIVKGPSSSLYGSEAMAGVVNLITEKFKGPLLEGSFRYGVANPDQGWGLPFRKESFEQMDATVQHAYAIGQWKIRQTTNFLYTDGISFRPYSRDRIPRPIHRLMHQATLQHTVGSHGDFRLLVRYNQDFIRQEFSVRNNGQVIDSYGRELNQELNIQPSYTHRFSPSLQLHSRGYFTQYVGDQQLHFLQKPDSLYVDHFEQRMYRWEEQVDWKKGKANFVVGGGAQVEQAQSTRYDALSNQKQNRVAYVFAQWEQPFSKKVTSVAGFRYDHNQLFQGAFTPKWALRYVASPKWSIAASMGRGFKAPDFRQLYLNFTNNAAGGYSVIGTQDAVSVISKLQQLGQIAELKPDFEKLKTLRPEQSTGINVGITYAMQENLSIHFNFFRNDIQSLIDVRQVATRVNGSQIFSYVNVNRAYTQGVEGNVRWLPFSKLEINTSYQWLQTSDKDEWARVKAGLEYVRTASGTSVVMSKNDYVGLPNRSKHQAQAKFRYQFSTHSFVYARFLYRSRWTVANTNGNGVCDKQDEFAAGYLQANLSAVFQLQKNMVVQTGIDNLFNYQDLNYLPNFQGRTVFVSFNYSFNHLQ